GRRRLLRRGGLFPAGGRGDDGDVSGLRAGLIGPRPRPAKNPPPARDDPPPRRPRGGGARAYARLFHVIPAIGADPSTVIAGLDPAIHLLRSKDVCSMDARVKPGHDGMDGPMIVGVISAAP